VARNRLSSPRTRLFVALEPAEPAPLAAWRDALVAGRGDLRPVPLHVTLVFLGWQYEKEVERIASLSSAVGSLPAARLTPRAVKPIPPRGWPRLFALDLEDEGDRATAAHAALSDSLSEARLYRPEKRPFWPHMTLARVKRERRAEPLEADALPLPLVARRVTLYRSTLRPQGAVYDALAGWDLAG
jgi:RNA 2',3'-cyclic 3'-phosphodiesterase